VALLGMPARLPPPVFTPLAIALLHNLPCGQFTAVYRAASTC
jgi:hypothetical protein